MTQWSLQQNAPFPTTKRPLAVFNLPGAGFWVEKVSAALPEKGTSANRKACGNFYTDRQSLMQRERLLCTGDDVDFALIFAESNSSVAKSKQSVVAAATNVDTGAETGAALTDNDGTGSDSFAAESLDTEKLGIAVATVAAAGLTFLMSHDITSKFYVNCY